VRKGGFDAGCRTDVIDHLLLEGGGRLRRAGHPGDGLFPVIDPALKTPDGIEATNPKGLVPRAVRELKQRFPELGLLTDVALDPYTSHGQDGVLNRRLCAQRRNHQPSWCARRWCRPKPASTSWRRRT
jgi:delta-aminolevulinic acid dehydratase/porphobilinogen synthase